MMLSDTQKDDDRSICECNNEYCELVGQLFCFSCNKVFSKECFERLHDTDDFDHSDDILEILKDCVIRSMEESVYMGPSIVAPVNDMERSQEGKVYRLDGSLMFEGEFEAGKYKYGKLYHEVGVLSYIGEFNEHGPEGIGKSYNKEGVLVYDGAFHNKVAHGVGVKYRDDGTKEYEGDFVFSLKDGFGKAYDEEENLVYEGHFQKDEIKGRGKKYHVPSGEVEFEGIFPEEYEDYLHMMGERKKVRVIFGVTSLLTFSIAGAIFFKYYLQKRMFD